MNSELKVDDSMDQKNNAATYTLTINKENSLSAQMVRSSSPSRGGRFEQ
jgi:hypothetical protein